MDSNDPRVKKLHRKAVLIGLTAGAVYSVTVIMGIYFCNWNPVCSGAAVNSGLCNAGMILYVPFIGPFWAAFLLYSATLKELIPFEEAWLTWLTVMGLSGVICILLCTFLGLVIGGIIERRRK